MKRDMLSIRDLSADKIRHLISAAQRMKKEGADEHSNRLLRARYSLSFL